MNSRANGRKPPPDDLLLFQRFCSELRVEDRPFELYPEQLEIVGPYFDGVTETLVILSKKNGKSTLIAALIIFHLLTVPDAECIVVAVSREQAGIILRQARGFIARSPALRKRFKVLQRDITSLEDGGRARVLAADEDTAEGVIPTLAIIDELHGAKSVALYDSLRMGLDGRQGQMVTITIAGSSMDSPLGQKRRRAYEMPGFVRDPKRRRSYLRTADFAFLEWCLNPDDDPNNLDIVKLVNPAPWKTKERLAKLQAAVTPWSWLRLACGIWTEGEEPAVPPELWDPLADAEDIPDGSQIWVGVALGQRREETAIAKVRFSDERIDSKVEILTGNVTYRQIQDAVRALRGRFDVLGMVYVNVGFEHAADELESEGLRVEMQPLSEQRAEKFSAMFRKLVEDGKFHHDGDPRLRAHVMGATIKETGKGWRFDPASQRPIAGLLALAATCDVVLSQAPIGDVFFGWA